MTMRLVSASGVTDEGWDCGAARDAGRRGDPASSNLADLSDLSPGSLAAGMPPKIAANAGLRARGFVSRLVSRSAESEQTLERGIRAQEALFLLFALVVPERIEPQLGFVPGVHEVVGKSGLLARIDAALAVALEQVRSLGQNCSAARLRCWVSSWALRLR